MNNDKNRINLKKKELRNYLANCGWQEIITYSLISLEMSKNFENNKVGSFFQLLRPKNEYHKYFRHTLVPSHLEVIKYNFSYQNKNLLFFEISSVYNLFREEELLILSGTGKTINQPLHQFIHKLDFYWLKGALENIFARWQIESEISFSPASLDYLNFSQSAEVFLGQKKIGFLGRVHSRIEKNYQIEEPVWVAQLSLTKIFDYLKSTPPAFSYQQVSNFPVSERDLSFIFPEEIDYQRVIKEIKKIVADNLQTITIFDIYQNTELKQKGKKSVSLRIVFQSSTHTLENKQVEKIVETVSKQVENLFGAKLRG